MYNDIQRTGERIEELDNNIKSLSAHLKKARQKQDCDREFCLLMQLEDAWERSDFAACHSSEG